MLLIPGTIQTDMSMDGAFITGFTYFSAAIYPWLYFLNLFWFHKMIKAAMRMFSDEDEEGTETK